VKTETRITGPYSEFQSRDLLNTVREVLPQLLVCPSRFSSKNNEPNSCREACVE